MTKIDFDMGRSLQELEGVDWGEPGYESSLVIECYRLRRVPLKEFDVENIRRMIGQQIGLRYLVPLALRELRQRPHAEGNLYEGALLHAVLSIDADFWEARPDLAGDLLTLVNNLSSEIDRMTSFERNGILKVLNETGPVFLRRCSIPGANLVDYGKPQKDADFTDDDLLAWLKKAAPH